MSEYGKLIMRRPLEAYARQWTPYSRLPDVVEVAVDVVQAPKAFDPNASQEEIEAALNANLQNGGFKVPKNEAELAEMFANQNMFGAGQQKFSIVTHGEVVCYGEKAPTKIRPRDWVLYHATAKKPIAVISDEEKTGQYTEEVVKFCKSCEGLLKGNANSTDAKIEQLRKLFAEGKTFKVPGPDGTEVELKSMEDWEKMNAIYNGVKK